MSDVPNINDMLKLYTKKELWERIQHHIKKIDNLQHQLDHQKEMWKDLKKWLKDYIQFQEEFKVRQSKIIGTYILGNMIDANEVLEKMQELENGEKDDI